MWPVFIAMEEESFLQGTSFFDRRAKLDRDDFRDWAMTTTEVRIALRKFYDSRFQLARVNLEILCKLSFAKAKRTRFRWIWWFVSHRMIEEEAEAST